MKRRTGNVDAGKPPRRQSKRTAKFADSVYGSSYIYIKFFMVWAFIIFADFILEFRFEYLWPLWLLIQSCFETFKCQGLVYSMFFVCIAITSDTICFLFIPIQWLFFMASTYVWIHYVWHTEKGLCLPTALLWFVFMYVEATLRLKDLHNNPFHIELCRPFAAHCIGHPFVTLGIGFKSYISYRLRVRTQQQVQKENDFYYELLKGSLPTSALATASLQTTRNNHTLAITDKHEPPVTNGGLHISRKSESTNRKNHKNSSSTTDDHCCQNGDVTTQQQQTLSSLRSTSSSNNAATTITSTTTTNHKSTTNTKHIKNNGGGSGSRRQRSHDVTTNSTNTCATTVTSSSGSSSTTSSASSGSSGSSGGGKKKGGSRRSASQSSSSSDLHSSSSNNQQQQQRTASKSSPKSTKQQETKSKNSNKQQQHEITTTLPNGCLLNGDVINTSSNKVELVSAQSMIETLESQVSKFRSELEHLKKSDQESKNKMDVIRGLEKSAQNELKKLKEEHESLQTKYQSLCSGKQKDKLNIQTMEKKLKVESENRTSVEKLLQEEIRRHKEKEETAKNAAAAISSKEKEECEHLRQMKKNLEAEMSTMHNNLKKKEEGYNMLKKEVTQREKSVKESETLMSALEAMQEKNAMLENSLSAETKIKLDLFSALGDHKRQLEIAHRMILKRDSEIAELKSRMTDMVSVMPNSCVRPSTPHYSTSFLEKPSIVRVGPNQGDYASTFCHPPRTPVPTQLAPAPTMVPAPPHNQMGVDSGMQVNHLHPIHLDPNAILYAPTTSTH